MCPGPVDKCCLASGVRGLPPKPVDDRSEYRTAGVARGENITTVAALDGRAKRDQRAFVDYGLDQAGPTQAARPLPSAAALSSNG